MARTVATSASTMKNTPNGNRWRMARRNSWKTRGKRNGPSSMRVNVARSSTRNSVPRPFRSPSYHDAASRASSSASGRTASRGTLPTGSEAMLYSFNDLLPRSGFFRYSVMRRETFFQEGLLPLLQRHLVDVRGDVIPERLHVVNLFFDRKRLEPGGRQRQGMGHARTIPSACPFV